LLRATDGNWYVTKFQNNPQHIRVLANEMLATKVGLALGLPMPHVAVIEVSDWLIEHTAELGIQLGGPTIPCRSGKQFGSHCVGPPDRTLDYMPSESLGGIRNVADFAGVLVLDKWTCNADGRQAVFWHRTPRSRRYDATFTDQGYCFNAGEWTFPDYALRGVFANNCVYEGVTGWDAFEPALTGAEEMDSDAIWGAQPTFRKSGTKEIETDCTGWWTNSTVADASFGGSSVCFVNRRGTRFQIGAIRGRGLLREWRTQAFFMSGKPHLQA